MAEPGTPRRARMENADIADVLAEIGELLEISGESVFRVGAYERAAMTIRSLARDLADIYDAGGLKGLQSISGVGKSTAEKVVEMLTTGTCAYLDELRQSFPASLVTLLQIPGVGPKKIKLFYDELGVGSVEQLNRAAKAGSLRELKGMSAKSEENVLRGIAQYREHHERILLSQAYPLASRIGEELAALPFVERADMAGSLRRFKETIGDIDIIASATEPERVMDAFTSLPQVVDVIARGQTKGSVRTRAGLQVDLRVVAPDQYGAALQYFTGSKAHNVHIRELARKRDLKINEYGVFEMPADRRIAGATEEEVYATLDLPLIPAVLREDRGEIEAATEGRLPELVGLADIRGDLHVHTNWSDAMQTIDEVAEAALELGYEYVAISDHAFKLPVAGGLDPKRLEEQLDEIVAVSKRYPKLTILSASEVNIDNDGHVDFEEELLDRLDIVAASIHVGFSQSREQITARTLAAIANPHVDIICHPTGRILGRRDPFAIDLEAVFQAAAEHDTALELNSFPDRLDLRDDYLRAAKGFGAKIAINTDAHRVDQLRYMMYGVATAQRGWLEPDDVINTYPLAKLRAWLASRSAGEPGP